MVAVREYLNEAMWRVSAEGICNVIANTIQSRTAANIMAVTSVLNFPKSVCLRTAQRWLAKLGWIYGRNKKGYVDGHEREDVVDYRQNVFLPKLKVNISYP